MLEATVSNIKSLKATDITSKMLYQNISTTNNAVQNTWEVKWSQTLNHPKCSGIFQTLQLPIAIYNTQSTVWQQITGS